LEEVIKYFAAGEKTMDASLLPLLVFGQQGHLTRKRFYEMRKPKTLCLRRGVHVFICDTSNIDRAYMPGNVAETPPVLSRTTAFVF
jgi:hypothetical protein